MARKGITWEGDELPYAPSRADDFAVAVFNMLCDGMGGIDWSGLDLAVEKFGIEDVDALIDRLTWIKNHESPEDLQSEATRGA